MTLIGQNSGSCSASAKNKSPFPHEFPPPIRLSSPGFSCSVREKTKPRNGAGEISITAAAEIARETVSATNRFEHETVNPANSRENSLIERQYQLQYQLVNNWLRGLS